MPKMKSTIDELEEAGFDTPKRVMDEYKLIQEKRSGLSRQMRSNIVWSVETGKIQSQINDL